jgi:hypothetical protein
MFIENNKAKTTKQLRELLSRQTFILVVILFFTMWSVKVFAQNQSVKVRKETNFFTSYVLLLEQGDTQNKVVTDSLKIFIPFQDIQMLDFSVVNDELFVIYESNGTNRTTRGVTFTLLRYNLKEKRIILNDSMTIAKGANPEIRATNFSIYSSRLKVTNKKQQIKEYDISSSQKYLNLANDIIKDFTSSNSNTPSAGFRRR